MLVCFKFLAYCLKSKLSINWNLRNKSFDNQRKKRATSSPIQLYVETLPVVDLSIYLDHQRVTGSTNQTIVFSHMKVYFSHVFHEVITLHLILFKR
jgi:hypothetical protein